MLDWCGPCLETFRLPLDVKMTAIVFRVNLRLICLATYLRPTATLTEILWYIKINI